MVVVDTAPLVLLVESGHRALLGFTVKPNNSVCPEFLGGVDEGVQTIFVIFQYVVCISADDYTRALLSKLQDHITLNIPKKISSRQAVKNAGNGLVCKCVGENGLTGCVLAVFFDIFGRKTGFQGDMLLGPY